MLACSDRQAAHLIVKYSILFIKKRDFMYKGCSSFFCRRCKRSPHQGSAGSTINAILIMTKLFLFSFGFATMEQNAKGYIPYLFAILARFCYSKSDAHKDIPKGLTRFIKTETIRRIH